jgi:hypothetical protein
MLPQRKRRRVDVVDYAQMLLCGMCVRSRSRSIFKFQDRPVLGCRLGHRGIPAVRAIPRAYLH